MEVTDPRSGFDSVARTFHSLRPSISGDLLPPETLQISAAEFSVSLFLRRRNGQDRSSSFAVVDSSTGQRFTYSDFLRRFKTLASNLRWLSSGHVAFVVSPNLVQIPVLYFALLSLGVVVSPANPVATEPEIAELVELSRPKIAFATSATARKVSRFVERVVLIDSPEFESMMTMEIEKCSNPARVRVSQSDVAAIMYSSGTTGRVKGVEITHRNLIAAVAGLFATARARSKNPTPAVVLFTIPYFHVYGFLYSFKSVATAETTVTINKFDIRVVLRAIEEFGVTNTALVPPILSAITKGRFTNEFDLSSLESVDCGGAPLGKRVVADFVAKFPNVALLQGYGLTESTGVCFRMVNREESLRFGSAGKLNEDFVAKIVDPLTGHTLSHSKQGELWIKGPSIMKGYVRDKESTSTSLIGEGWLRTGDLCCIDEQGYLFVLDRLKELIKFKAYQVAPAELEQLLQSHPDVLDAAVIPYPDEEAGEVPMAIVVKRPNSNLGESQVMEFVAQQVSWYKKIRRVAFVESISKTGSGKILRRELRNIFIPSFNSSSRL